VLRDLHRRYVAGRELAADRRAMDACGRKPLASALVRVVAGPAWPELATAAAMAAPDMLEARVEQMETGEEPDIARVTPGSIVLTIPVAGVLAWGSIASMVAMSNAMEVGSMSAIDGGMSWVGAVWMGALALALSWVAWRLLQAVRSSRAV
jgi:hypothetical protein